jgi:hypothetical protein
MILKIRLSNCSGNEKTNLPQVQQTIAGLFQNSNLVPRAGLEPAIHGEETPASPPFFSIS